jgi:hypothetical protein
VATAPRRGRGCEWTRPCPDRNRIPGDEEATLAPWLVTVACAAAPEGLVVSLGRPTWELGEAEWLDIRLDNHGSSEVHYSGLYNREERGGLVVVVTDADGEPVPDPFHASPSGWAMNGGISARVPPGGTGTVVVDLARYAWIDQPGTYHVVVTVPIEGGRVAETDVVVTEPADLRAAVTSHPKSDWMQPGPTREFFEALGHARFVPILEELAVQSLPPLPDRHDSRSFTYRTDDRALAGLAACPCVESTEALLRLYDQLQYPDHRRVITDELLLRVPGDPRRSPSATWFASRSWEPRFDQEVLRRARALLAAAPQATDADRRWATEVIERLGGPADDVVLADALGSTLRARVRVDDLVWLLRTRSVVPTDPDAALLLTLVRGQSAEAEVLRAVTSGNPILVAYGLPQAPAQPSAALFAAVVPLLESSDPYVADAVTGFVRAHPAPTVVDATLAGFAQATDARRVQVLANRARAARVPWDVVLDRVIATLGPGHPNAALVGVLTDTLSGWGGSSSGPVDDPELPALIAAWTTFVASHREALRAGERIPIVPGSTDPALVPRSFDFLVHGKHWP